MFKMFAQILLCFAVTCQVAAGYGNNPNVPDPPPEPQSTAKPTSVHELRTGQKQRSILPGIIIPTSPVSQEAASSASSTSPADNKAPALLKDESPPPTEIDGVEVTQTEREMILYLNAFRARYKLAPLVITKQIMERARNHAKWMAANHSMTHSAGIQENIAMGQTTAGAVTSVWDHSSGHHANMRTSNKECGVGFAVSKNGTRFWCQQFATGSEKWGVKKVPVPKPDTTSTPKPTVKPEVKPDAEKPTPPADSNNNYNYRRGLFRRW
jgi:uncharacterized protein YkwD